MFLIYGDKKGWGKRGQGERAAGACFACTGASVGEGVDRAPQCCLQLSDNSCSERRDVLRVLRHVSLFLHPSFHLSASSSHRTDIRHTHVQHPHTHPSLDDTHNFGACALGVHKKLAGCLCSTKRTQDKPGEAQLLMESVFLRKMFMKKFNDDADDRNSNGQAFVLTSKPFFFSFALV